MIQQEVRQGNLPAIVRPKPVRGRAKNLGFETGVHFYDHRFKIILRLDNRRYNDAPTRDSDCVNRERNDRRVSPLRKCRGKRGGGSKASKEWRPKAAVASVLVHEDAERAAVADEFRGREN